LVTGATGFIGRQLVPLLLAREGEINVLVRHGSRHRFAALREQLDPTASGCARCSATSASPASPSATTIASG
jgi:uncharacterized protein YbjT (DUF2867 family)